MTNNSYPPAPTPQPVTIVRPSAKETRASTLAMFFIGLPFFALTLWAAFLGVGNDLFNVDLSYWQCLLLMLGYRALRAGNAINLFTSKNPADK